MNLMLVLLVSVLSGFLIYALLESRRRHAEDLQKQAEQQEKLRREVEEFRAIFDEFIRERNI